MTKLLSETLLTKKILENNKFLFLFISLIFVPFGLEYFETPKYFFILVFSILSFFSLKLKLLKFNSWVTVSFSIYLLINFLSSLQISFYDSFFGFDFAYSNSLIFLVSMLFLLLYFSNTVFPKNFFTNLKVYFLVGVFISASIGILQYILKPFNLIPAEWFFDGRIASTMGHPNFLASIIVVGLIIAERIKLNWVRLVLLISLILTFSKLSIILYFLYIFGKYLITLYKQNRRIAVTLSLVSLIFVTSIGLGLFSNSYNELISSNKNMYQFQRFLFFLDPRELSLDLRFKIWNYGLKIVEDSPFFGYGKAHVPKVFDSISDELAFGYTIGSTHNLYLDIAIESGLLGLTTFLIFVVSCLFFSYKLKSKTLFFIQLFIFIHAFFDQTSVVLWLVLILTAGLSFNKSYLKQL